MIDALVIDGNMDLPEGKKGVYDYFIRDYQENVRMILSEESHYSLGQCTMETGRAANEEPVFGQTGGGNEVATTRFTKPTGWTSNSSSSVSKLSKLTGHTVGPNSLLKVMAGDELNARTDYYYQSPVANNSNSLLTDIVNTLVQAISGSTAASAPVKGGTSGISANLNASVPLANVSDPHRYTTDNIPRAYLNILFFDERFNFVPENSTAVRVSQSGDGAAPLVLPTNTKAPKNGFAYIYVSNENDDAVYFDNLQVSDNRGRIIEENHYYAFGLKIAGISSTKLGDVNEGLLKNQNLYNDKELMDETDLNWYDLGYRNYDPQTGRFLQIDPLIDEMPDFSAYLFAGNEPIGNIDLDGLAPIPGLNGTFANLGEVIVKSAPRAAQAAKAGLTVAQVGGIALKAANVAYNSVVSVARTFNTYVNPLSPLVELAIGKSVESDFTEEKSRVVSGAEAAIMFIPGGKIAGAAAKTAERVGFKTVAKEGSRFFEVGSYNTLKGAEAGLEAHHVGQRGLMKKFIPSYNSNTAPSVLVPKQGHTLGRGVVSRGTSGFTNARQVLARDILELRRVYPDVPNSSLQQLIQMNKTMYPEAFIK